MSYAKQLASLHDGVLARREDVLDEIKDTRPEAFPPTARLAVYSRGYFLRLAEITLSDYPATMELLGSERAEALADAYVQKTPSRVWDANDYSFGFAAFLAEALPKEKEVMAVALLESAIAQAFWAPDDAALPAEAMPQSEEAFAAYRFTPRASAQLCHLPAEGEAFIAAFRAGEVPAAVKEGEQTVLVLRHERTVERHVLEPMEATLLGALYAGTPIGEAVEAIADQEALLTRLPDYLNRWVSNGFFAEN